MTVLNVAEAVAVAVSLCADCFAVCACSATSLGKTGKRGMAVIAAVFAVVQAGLFAAGWGFGDAVSSLLRTFAHVLGFILLLYVGGSMMWEGRKGSPEGRDLRGFRNIILGAFATSIDALAVGISCSLDGRPLPEAVLQASCVFVVTAASVFAGIISGRRVGERLGPKAEIAGGAILVIIGVLMLF